MRRWFHVGAGMREGAIGAGVCVGMVVVIALYAAALNRLYYRSYGPFFDSLSFDNELATVQSVADTSGFVAAIRSTSGSTVVLPWIVAAAGGRGFAPSRLFGVYYQAVLLLAALFSIFMYLIRAGGWRWIDAAAAVLAVLSMRCLYQTDGGLSDFRMDLGMCLLFTATVCWVLVAVESGRPIDWAVAGVFAAAACLDRATTPLYFVAALAPPFVLHAIGLYRRERSRVRRYWLGVLLFTVIAVAGAGWMYATRWQQLQWYYRIWNRHALTHGPVVPTLLWHLRHALNGVGLPGILILLVFTLIGPSGILRDLSGVPELSRSLRWRLLYIGLAPLLLLAVQGAGHNPFVALPATAGFTLFLICPFNCRSTARGFAIGRRGVSTAAVVLCVTAVTAYSAAAGAVDHLRPQSGANLLAGEQSLLRVLLSNCVQGRVNTFTTAEFGCANNRALLNVLLFEDGFRPCPAGIHRGNLCLATDPTFEPTEPVEWAALPGCTDAEKIDRLGQRAAASLDFIILGDSLTAAHMQQHGFASEINKHVIDVRSSIVAHGRWKAVGRPAVVSANEVMIVYRNADRIR